MQIQLRSILTPIYIKNQENKNSQAKLDSSKKSIFKIIGPGVVTGASDDDPSGMATYSQDVAKFGLGMLWMALFQLPMMMVIQEICARIGLLTGKGLAAVIQIRYSKKIVYAISALLIIANTIKIGVDISAMAASIKLIFPVLPIILLSSITIFILVVEVFVFYKKYVIILKYLTLSLAAYAITAVIVGRTWNQIFLASIIPNFEFKSDFARMFVAMLGTTISPYLFFWQTSEEAEEDVLKKKIKEIGKGKPKITKWEIKIMKEDIALGMFLSEFITRTIIITTAGSLHANGITNIQTAGSGGPSS
ncbi:MAG: NRAMP family divalent metal transporter [Candidatus Eiseniibacteriota bacterium]